MNKECISVFHERFKYDIIQSDIDYIKAYNSYTVFYVSDKVFRRDDSLKDIYDKELDHNIFFRINRSTIINVNRVAHYKHGTIKIGNAYFKISRVNRQNFDRYYVQCIIGSR